MKPLFLFFVLVTGLSCIKSSDNCVADIPDWCAAVDLSTEYNPVCGCDGLTYTNSGHAECIGGVSYTEGACD